MKWFWYSLIGFCILMCSCRSKKVAYEANSMSEDASRMEWARFQALKDTSSSLRIEIDKGKLKIIERITITEYDKDTGAVTKKTETERETTQDSDKVVTQEEESMGGIHSQDSLKHLVNVTKKTENNTKTVTDCNGLDSFGKWFGVTIGCIVGLLFVYLLKKFRVY